MLATNLRKFKEQAKQEGRREGREEGKREGREEGERVGLQKGRTEGLLTIARNMKADGISWETIQRYTGLSLEQIEKL